MKRFSSSKINEDSSLHDEAISAIMYYVGLRRQALVDALNDHGLNAVGTFHFFNNNTVQKIRNERRNDILTLVVGNEKAATRMADKIRTSKNYVKYSN
jgi:hypothetical protein